MPYCESGISMALFAFDITFFYHDVIVRNLDVPTENLELACNVSLGCYIFLSHDCLSFRIFLFNFFSKFFEMHLAQFNL